MFVFKEIEKRELLAPRDGYGKALLELGEENKDVVVLSADLARNTRCHWFKEKFPNRFIEVGVAEQNMMGIASGLALYGKIPFVSSFAVFSPGHNWAQLRESVCFNDANVKIAGSHAGFSAGINGASDQSLEDIAITRVLPGLKVIVPCDFEQTKKAVKSCTEIEGPVYVRFGKEKIHQITTKDTEFVFGNADIYKEGDDVAIISCGSMVYESLKAVEFLKKQNISVMVINCHTIKPLDAKIIISSAKKTGAIVTVEEHQVNGGLGGAVAELISENYPVIVKKVGVQDSFGESGRPYELIQKYRISYKDIMKAVKNALFVKYSGPCAEIHEMHPSLARFQEKVKPRYTFGFQNVPFRK